MTYKDDWERTQKMFEAFWQKENHNRPLIHVTAPKEGYCPKEPKFHGSVTDKWTNIEYIIESARESFSSTYFGGEAFPVLNPNLGPDIFGAFIGCELDFGESTSWARHFVTDWGNRKIFEFDPLNKWWKKIKEITEAAIADAHGDYLVGITDLHPGMDGLVSLRGPEELCMDLYDSPDEVKKAGFEELEVYKIVLNSLYILITQNQKGSTNWMGIWHPGKWYVTSTDFICMISNEMFAEFILPELLEEIKLLDATIFHLDGPGALKHLDALLEVPEINGIQWVYGAGQPSASHWIHVLKKIQDKGKLVVVNILPEELDVLMENLKPEGVIYMTSCKTEPDARDLLKKAEDYYKSKR